MEPSTHEALVPSTPEALLLPESGRRELSHRDCWLQMETAPLVEAWSCIPDMEGLVSLLCLAWVDSFGSVSVNAWRWVQPSFLHGGELGRPRC